MATQFNMQQENRQWQSLWINANLATMDNTRTTPYGAVENAALAVADQQIAWLGPMAELPPHVARETIDCQQRWLTPGLIDCHTHLVYGGNRAREFEQRLQGVSYEEIARRGGGILSTVSATRAATKEELFSSAAQRLRHFLEEGVTGLEIKSGYGLNLEDELKMLKVARELALHFPVHISTTFLGAHTTPPEFEHGDAYIDYLCEQVLPVMAKNGLADCVDIFCESIGFDLNQTRRYFDKAQALGLPIKAHVEQLSNMGGAQLASSYGALSADHLEYLDANGVEALRQAGSVAVLLPGAYYCLREAQTPPIQRLRDKRVPMAIGTDCNPGSSPVTSLLLMLNMACTLFALTPEEALTGVTRHGARALGWQDRCGVLKAGLAADFVLWDIQHPAELAYNLGLNPSRRVVVGGRTVLQR